MNSPADGVDMASLSCKAWRQKEAEDIRFGLGNMCDTGLWRYRCREALIFLCLSLAFTSLSACITKSKAKAQAREAFIAGQQEAMARMAQQPQKPSVTFIGPVKNPTIPWTHELTLAKAILAAGYIGAVEPSHIMIVRNNQAIPV